MYRCKLKLDDKQIKLFEKNILTEGLTRLNSIKFKNVENLRFDYNNFYRIDDLATSSIERLKILSLHHDSITDLNPLGS